MEAKDKIAHIHLWSDFHGRKEREPFGVQGHCYWKARGRCPANLEGTETLTIRTCLFLSTS